MNHRSPDAFLAYVARRDPDQPEFLQAVKEVRRFNTVLGPPADFPFRVLYSCAPPGHRCEPWHKNEAAWLSGAATA